MSVIMKFLDGSPVSQDYLDKLQVLLDDACQAEELYNVDELERKI